MKICFLTHLSKKYAHLGGNFLINILAENLKQFGHSIVISENINELVDSDFVILPRSYEKKDPFYPLVELLKKPYCYIPFHDDYIKFCGLQKSFFCYVTALALGKEAPGMSLEKLLEIPEIIHYHEFMPNNSHLVFYPIYKNAQFCLANTPTEKKTIIKDCPQANVETIFLSAGQLANSSFTYSKKFLNLLPEVTERSYILQVGRFSYKKNQLASILATRNLDIPLVFVSSDILDSEMEYFHSCLLTIKKYRRAPTYIITTKVPSYSEEKLHIINLANNKIIDQEMLASAYQNAGLYLHPAFSELPGYVYLEAAKIGTPIVASSWATINDYFIKDGKYLLDDRIEYVVPYHINQIEEAIKKQFGRNLKPSNHPILQRSHTDFAKDFDLVLRKYAK